MGSALMAKKKPETAHTTSTGSIRIAPDLAYKLRIIVEADKMSVAEFLDPIIRSSIEANFKRVSEHLAKLAQEQPKS